MTMKSYTEFARQLPTPRPIPAPCIIAVTKKQPPRLIHQAYELGYRHFGESTLQGLESLINEFRGKTDVYFHFVGYIQSNKIKKLCALPLLTIHSVSKESQLLVFRKQMSHQSHMPSLLLQINVANNAHQAGFIPNLHLIKNIYSEFNDLPIIGLMAIGPNPSSFESPADWKKATEIAFEHMAVLFSDLKKDAPARFSELSMGMSEDYAEAIRHGASMIRIGSAIFGDRIR